MATTQFPKIVLFGYLGLAEKVTGMPTVRRLDADVYEYLKERQRSRRYACVYATRSSGKNIVFNIFVMHGNRHIC